MEAILEITDGTTKINLLDAHKGFHLIDWQPSFPQAKDGGVFRSSPFAPGRALVNRQFDNLFETFTVSVDADSQDTLIAHWTELIDLLEGALDYWLSSANFTPVYFKARASCETNERYAVVKNYSIPSLSNPYFPPFFSGDGRFSTPDIPITIELGLWTAYAPGSSVCLPLAAQSDTYGSASTCTNGIVLGNKHVAAQITHAYHFDASGASFSANLIGAAKPQALFPAVPAAGDILYVGISTAAANPGPFSSIIFDIGTAAVSITSIAYEFWNGAAWTALTAQTYVSNEINNTFVVNTGVIGFYFLQPTAMESTAINGVTAYWIRFRITAVGANPTPPYQQNRDIYSAIYPYVTVDADDVPGSMDALAQYILKTRSSAGSGVLFPMASEFIIAARSTWRGLNFTPYINLSDAQTPANTFLTLGANTTYQNDSVYANGTGAPTGRLVRYAPGAATAAYASRVLIELQIPLADEFTGRYHAFLRFAVETTASGDDFSIKLLYGFSSRESEEYTTQTTGFQMCSLGVIDLAMDENVGNDNIYSLPIDIWVAHNVATNNTLYLYDLILMPADEMLIQSIEAFSENNPLDKTRVIYRMEIDGLENPKQTARTRQYFDSSGYLIDIWRTLAPAGVLAKHSSDHRLWFLQSHYPELALSPQALINPRYHIMRGAA